MGGSLRIIITDRSYLLCMRVVVIKKCHSTVYICRGKDVVCVCMASRGFVGGGRGLKQPALPGLSLLLPRRSDISNCLYLLMLWKAMLLDPVCDAWPSSISQEESDDEEGRGMCRQHHLLLKVGPRRGHFFL